MNQPLVTLEKGVSLIFSSEPDRSHFFGYYDKSPLDASGTRLLAHRCDFDGRMPSAEDDVEVGYITLPQGKWNGIGRTAAFNWQQGAMLQWLGPDFQTRVIFNTRRSNRYCSVVYDTVSCRCQELGYPVYAVHPSGTFALGANFERQVFVRRGYHYEGVSKLEWDVPLHPDDGIFRVDLETGQHRLLIRTEDVARLEEGRLAGERHWLEHMLWNRGGSRFLFLYRHGVGDNYQTDLLSADSYGRELYRFPGADLYSHAAWRSESEFVIYAVKRNPLYRAYVEQSQKRGLWFRPVRAAARGIMRVLRARKSVRSIGHGHYYLCQDQTAQSHPIPVRGLRGDGHPSWTADGRYMLTDTYADDEGFRHLLLYECQSGKVFQLGRFWSPYNSTGFRCDLHPRFSRKEAEVIVDSAHPGRRVVMVLGIDWKVFD